MISRWFWPVAVIGMMIVPGCNPVPKPQPPSADSTGVSVTPSENEFDVVSDFTPHDTLPTGREGQRRTLGPTKLPFGLFNWPSDKWGTQGLMGITGGCHPKYIGGNLRKANGNNMAMICFFPRNLMQLSNDRYSPDMAKKLVDDYVRYFPPDSIAKYIQLGVLKGFSVGDDVPCSECYGGQAITQTQMYDLIKYARSKFTKAGGPRVPLGIRVSAAWIASNASLRNEADFAWGQYRTLMGTPAKYYGTQISLAKQYGMKLVCGLNIHSIDKAGQDNPATGAEIQEFLPLCIDSDVTCAVLSWRYDQEDWNFDNYKSGLLAMRDRAATKPAQSCARAA